MTPRKYSIYWDMNIPTEFYEEEFIEFEKYMEFTGNIRMSTAENPHATSTYHLAMFRNYEKFLKKENKKISKLNNKKNEKKSKSARNATVKAQDKRSSQTGMKPQSQVTGKWFNFLLVSFFELRHNLPLLYVFVFVGCK